jgi:hypothetical protein
MENLPFFVRLFCVMRLFNGPGKTSYVCVCGGRAVYQIGRGPQNSCCVFSGPQNIFKLSGGPKSVVFCEENGTLLHMYNGAPEDQMDLLEG